MKESSLSLNDLERYHFDRLAKRAGVTKLPSAPFNLSQVLKVMLNPQSPLEVTTQAALMASMEAWQRAGAQVYELDASLLSRFEQRELGGLKGSALKLPQPLYLHLEGCPITLTSERVKAPLTGLYVVEVGEHWLISMIGRGEPKDVALSFLWPHTDWLKRDQGFEAFLADYFGQARWQERASACQDAMRLIARTLLYLGSDEAKLHPVDDLERQRLLKDLRRLKGRRLEAARQALATYSAAAVTRLA